MKLVYYGKYSYFWVRQCEVMLTNTCISVVLSTLCMYIYTHIRSIYIIYACISLCIYFWNFKKGLD